MQETRVPSLDGEDPLKKEMATHSSILAWEIPWTGEPGGLSIVHGSQRVRHDLVTKQQQQSSEAGKTNKSSRSHESSYLCGVGLDTKGYQGTL